MDLEFSEDEAALRDNVRDVLAGACPPSLVRGVYEGKDETSGLWDRLVQLDWPALAVDEDLGGLGLGFVEVAIVAEELGRAVAPGPFLATVTQFVPTVRELGSRAHHEQLLTAVASGRTGTLALTENGSWDPARVRATARRSGDEWVLSGSKASVLDGDTAAEVVVIARAEGTHGTDGLGAFVVEGSALSSVHRPSVDATLRIADLALDGVRVPADRVLAEPGSDGVAVRLRRALDEATIAVAVSTVGTCRRILEMTIDYAKVREQYGRPIGSFQALKHRMAEMYLAVERATALAYYAALTVAEDDPRRSEAASLAKAAASDCQRLVAQDGLQLHGGIGYTWEHDLHFFLKRAKAGEGLLGTGAAHRVELARLIGLASTATSGKG